MLSLAARHGAAAKTLATRSMATAAAAGGDLKLQTTKTKVSARLLDRRNTEECARMLT